MTTQAEIDMQARLADMERQIAELAAKVNPLYSGGMDRYIHSGYLQWDGIGMRFDDNGQQVLIPDGDSVNSQFWVAKLSNNPSLPPVGPKIQIGGAWTTSSPERVTYSILAALTPTALGNGANSAITMQGRSDLAQLQLAVDFEDDGAGIYFKLVDDASNPRIVWSLDGGVNENTLGGGSSMGVVLDARDWATSAGYDFWFVPGSGDLVAASSATNISGLDSYGWTTTALSFTAGGAGDFLSSTDHEPSYVDFDANGDTLISPDIFGSYAHMLQAAELLGSTPTTLIVEFYAAWPVASANEGNTYIGLGTGETVIQSNGTNFLLSTAGASDTGAAVDTAWHRWKIVVGASTTEWFIDGVSQGTASNRVDSWPMPFKVAISTTNRIRLAWARVKYA